MDRRSRLCAAYRQALEAGEELLRVLEGPPGPGFVDRIVELVDRRGVAAEAAASLFQPGDQQVLQAELRALVEQQRLLEERLGRFMDGLQQAVQAAGRTRSTMSGTRRLINPGQRGRWIDEVR